jgi:hypothetical protein
MARGSPKSFKLCIYEFKILSLHAKLRVPGNSEQIAMIADDTLLAVLE